MRSIKEDMDFYRGLLDMLEAHFGKDLEIVLHDLTNEYGHTIVDIRNGHISGREIGGSGVDLGLKVLQGKVTETNSNNEILRTSDGKTLRCSTAFIRDDKGQVIGSVCMNQDITKTIELEQYLHGVNRQVGEAAELFPSDVGSLLNKLIVKAQDRVNKPAADMTKEDRIQFIKYLDEYGAFLISKSGVKICKYLGISKFTLYNYLESIRADGSSEMN